MAEPQAGLAGGAEPRPALLCKDANDVLVQKGIEAVQNCIHQATPLPQELCE